MACMHCTDAPCAAVCPVNCFYTTADAVVLHSKDLCIGCGYCFYACPFGAPQYPKVGNFGSRGKMDKCTFCAGGPEADNSKEEYEKYGANRLAEGKLPLCAEMCSTKSLLAGDGEIIAQIYKERVVTRGYGSGAWGWKTAYKRNASQLEAIDGRYADDAEPPKSSMRWARKIRTDDMAGLLSHARFIVGALALMFVVAAMTPVAAQQRNPDNSVNPTASSVKEEQLLQRASAGAGPRQHSRPEVGNADPAGRPLLAGIPRSDAALDRRHRDHRHAGRAGALLSDPRHGARSKPAARGGSSCASTRSSASCIG